MSIQESNLPTLVRFPFLLEVIRDESTIKETHRVRLANWPNFEIVNATTTGPPGSPDDGDAYIPAATATGVWAGFEKHISIYDLAGTEWFHVVPKNGMRVWNDDTGDLLVYKSSLWHGRRSVVTVAASTVLTPLNGVVLANASSASVTITLPAASSMARFFIKKIDSSGNTVTVTGDGAETVDGEATQVLASQYDSIEIVSDGSNWFII